MGYHVDLMWVNAYIPADKLDEAYQILCDLNNRNDLKRGGAGGYAFGGTPAGEEPVNWPHPNVWFSWMPWNYPELYSTAQRILEEVGFEMAMAVDGDLHFVGYSSKTGCEDRFLEALAPCLIGVDGVDPYFCWHGEDDSIWMQVLREVNGVDTLVNVEAKMVPMDSKESS